MRTTAGEETRGRLLLCFDFEGAYGMPHNVPYDLASGAERILEVLASHGARATFFVVGRMVEEHPDVVAALADAGHDIGLHGYDHDHLDAYDARRLAQLDRDLARVESAVEELTGSRPRCFRAPYLLAPQFYRREIYELLGAHGYRWVSNQEVRYPVEWLRPDRKSPYLLAPRFYRREIYELLAGNGYRVVSNQEGRYPVDWLRPDRSPLHHALDRFWLGALNRELVMAGKFGSSPVTRLRWLLSARRPFLRDGLVEVPVYAPLDCDLLGLPHPDQETPANWLVYTRAALRSFVVNPGAPLAMITFHDWVVAGGNRLVLLEEVLQAAQEASVHVSTVATHPGWLDGITPAF